MLFATDSDKTEGKGAHQFARPEAESIRRGEDRTSPSLLGAVRSHLQHEPSICWKGKVRLNRPVNSSNN